MVRTWDRARLRRLASEIAQFSVVGGISTAVTITLFNLLVHGGDAALLHTRPVLAYALGTGAGTCVAFLGNRYGAFRHRRTGGFATDYLRFALINLVGLAIPATCLAFSRYVLDLGSVMADNVSANVVGLGFATLFRFWAYRRWVFRSPRPRRPESADAARA